MKSTEHRSIYWQTHEDNALLEYHERHMSYEEIAKALGRSVLAVKCRLLRLNQITVDEAAT